MYIFIYICNYLFKLGFKHKCILCIKLSEYSRDRGLISPTLVVDLYLFELIISINENYPVADT